MQLVYPMFPKHTKHHTMENRDDLKNDMAPPTKKLLEDYLILHPLGIDEKHPPVGLQSPQNPDP